MACRKEPAPLSLVFVTVKVAPGLKRSARKTTNVGNKILILFTVTFY